MINPMQAALIKKDLLGVTKNKNFIIMLLTVPLVMTIFMPSMFIIMIGVMPLDSPDFKELLVLLPTDMLGDNIRLSLVQLVLNNIVPMFFLVIPIMTASVMAASSFVGEKEKRTLETLLYCPLSLRQIFIAKIIASFLLSQIVSLASFVVMMLVVQTEMWFILGSLMLPGLNWLVLLLLVSPAFALVAITLIVRGSAKAKSMEESQQRGAFLVMPVIFLAVAQFSGVVMVNAWILLAIGVICVAIGLIFLRQSSANFYYERLLQ
jgi:ABC-type Na+ efflux pump permease subunit